MAFFSIITVTYNAESTVTATMRSVAEQLFTDFEHIVQDGASTDSTLRIVGEWATPQCRVESEPDKGLYYAMNEALARARGEYVVFLNAGDAFHSPDTLRQIHDAIEGCGENRPGVVYGQTVLVDAEGHVVGKRHLDAPRELDFRSFADGMVVCHQAFFARRDLTCPYDTAYRFSADYDWCVKILKKSPSNCYVDDIVADYLHEGVTTANHKKSLRERFAIMCRYYGTLSTCLRHLRFAGRHLKRKLIS